MWCLLMDIVTRVNSMIALMRRLGLTELDVRIGSERIGVRRPTDSAVDQSKASSHQDDGGMVPAADIDGHPVLSPLAGTFFGTPRPGAEPFVQVGDFLGPGAVIGMVEAMKVFNEVTSDAAGRVMHVLASSGDIVTLGQPLVILDSRDQPVDPTDV